MPACLVTDLVLDDRVAQTSWEDCFEKTGIGQKPNFAPSLRVVAQQEVEQQEVAPGVVLVAAVVAVARQLERMAE